MEAYKIMVQNFLSGTLLPIIIIIVLIVLIWSKIANKPVKEIIKTIKELFNGE
jgi:hypothetical protein